MTTAEAPFFHVGILVADLEAAMRRFHDLLGFDFAAPQTSVIPQLETVGETHQDVAIRVSYSLQGPTHLELIEATDDGVWGRQRGYGFHHIGRWTEDPAAVVDELAAQGLPAEAVMRSGETHLGAYFDPAALDGVRFEACPIAIRDGWQAWIHGRSEFEI